MCFLFIRPACTPPLLPPLSYGQYNFSLHLGEASLAHLLPSHAHSPDPHPACQPDGVDLWHSGGMTFEYSIWGDPKIRASLAALMVKNLPAMWETQVRSLGQEDPLEKGMATHSSILAWRIPWTEEPGGLQSMGLRRAGHDWATNTFTLFQDQSQRKPTSHYKSSQAGLHTLFSLGSWPHSPPGVEAPVAESQGVAQRHKIREEHARCHWEPRAMGRAISGKGSMVVTMALVDHTKGTVPGVRFGFIVPALVPAWAGSLPSLMLGTMWSVQLLRSVWCFTTLWMPPCPSPIPWVYSNVCPLSWWCHPTISSSVITFSSCPQSLSASGSFQMSQFFVSGGQSMGVSASTSVLPMNIQDWFPLEWTDWIFLLSKGLSRVLSNNTFQKRQFFGDHSPPLTLIHDYWKNHSFD